MSGLSGVQPRARLHSRLSSGSEERPEIARGLALVPDLLSTVRGLKQALSTNRQEVRRNGGHKGYCAARSDQRAWDRARRLKPCKLSFNAADAAPH